MKAHIVKDKKIRNLAKRLELKRQLLKRIISNIHLDSNTRWIAQIKLDGLQKNSSFSRVRNRCVITSRGYGVERNLGISRIVFRDLVRKGSLPGFKKAIW